MKKRCVVFITIVTIVAAAVFMMISCAMPARADDGRHVKAKLEEIRNEVKESRLWFQRKGENFENIVLGDNSKSSKSAVFASEPKSSKSAEKNAMSSPPKKTHIHVDISNPNGRTCHYDNDDYLTYRGNLPSNERILRLFNACQKNLAAKNG